jgi:heme exporter protein B
MGKEIRILLSRMILLELRNKYTISSFFLYVLITVYLCYLSFKTIEEVTVWNALFWIILVFAASNTATRSFNAETRRRQLYQYSTVSPFSVILSELIFNAILIVLVSGITLLFYGLFIGFKPLEGADLDIYFLTIILGGMGLSGTLTLISGISSHTSNGLGMVAILGFPLLLPLLLTLIDLSALSLRGLGWDYAFYKMLVLAGINGLMITLSFLLFPYLWRE